MTDDLHRITRALIDYTPGETTITIGVSEHGLTTSEPDVVTLMREQLAALLDVGSLDVDAARSRLDDVVEFCADILEGDHHPAAQALAVEVLRSVEGDV